jgi:hypothetical protein
MANGLKMTVSTTGQGTGGLTFLNELENEGTSTVRLDFSSSQTFDIEVSNIFSRPVWLWSHDKAFAMLVWALELKPGEVYSQQTDWDLKGLDNERLSHPRSLRGILACDLTSVSPVIPSGNREYAK